MISAALKIANRLERVGAIKRHAISGGIAVMYYAQPRETHDLDVMVLVQSGRHREETRRRIYSMMVDMGYRRRGNYVNIGGMDVQFFPVVGGLDKEAVHHSKRVKILGIWTRVILPEYLIAQKLYLGRPQDLADVQRLWEQTPTNRRRLQRIFDDYGLNKKWISFIRRFYVR